VNHSRRPWDDSLLLVSPVNASGDEIVLHLYGVLSPARVSLVDMMAVVGGVRRRVS
jgi:hypothetical protein